jgi:hypothetical protein
MMPSTTVTQVEDNKMTDDTTIINVEDITEDFDRVRV